MQMMIGALPLWLSMLAFPEQGARGTREQGSERDCPRIGARLDGARGWRLTRGGRREPQPPAAHIRQPSPARRSRAFRRPMAPGRWDLSLPGVGTLPARQARLRRAGLHAGSRAGPSAAVWRVQRIAPGASGRWTRPYRCGCRAPPILARGHAARNCSPACGRSAYEDVP
jgi:hypothetical protein